MLSGQGECIDAGVSGRFVSGGEPAGIYDDLGATAMDGVRKVVQDLDDAELLAWWKELDPDEA